MAKRSTLTRGQRILLALGCLSLGALEAPRAAGALVQAFPLLETGPELTGDQLLARLAPGDPLGGAPRDLTRDEDR